VFKFVHLSSEVVQQTALFYSVT